MTWEIRQGDCLDLLRAVPDGSVDAVITDPPYSSGGFTRGDRAASTTSKYQRSGTAREYDDFSGDSRDSRAWAYWCALWMSECRRIVKPSGYFLTFTDWRMLPTCADAIQAGGWVWRGVVPWNKGRGARAPHTGYFRHQCEYIVWGTNGVTRQQDGGPWDGFIEAVPDVLPDSIEVPVRQDDKHHLTGKPTDLMRRLVVVAPLGGLILDPFAGSGTTGVAAIQEGRRFLGFEMSEHYAAVAQKRLADAAAQPRLEIATKPEQVLLFADAGTVAP